MKILVKGDLNRLKKMKFECKECGCVFIANKKEYNAEHFMLNGKLNSYVSMRCPCCDFPVTGHEYKEEEE